MSDEQHHGPFTFTGISDLIPPGSAFSGGIDRHMDREKPKTMSVLVTTRYGAAEQFNEIGEWDTDLIHGSGAMLSLFDPDGHGVAMFAPGEWISVRSVVSAPVPASTNVGG